LNTEYIILPSELLEEDPSPNETIVMATTSLTFGDGGTEAFLWLLPEASTNAFNLSLRLDSHLYLFSPCNADDCECLEIREVYKVKGEELKKNVIGRWRKSTESVIWSSLPEDLWKRRSNLTGLTLVNLFLPYPPFAVERNDSDVPEGMVVDIMDIFAEEMGFLVEWTKPDDGRWGKLSENG